MVDVEALTVREIREIAKLAGGGCRRAKKKPPLPFKVGDSILVRTVTMIQLGMVAEIGRDFLVLEGGGWVADTGRFSEMLATGKINEYEKVPSWMLVGRGAICDVFPWPHPLPRETK